MVNLAWYYLQFLSKAKRMRGEEAWEAKQVTAKSEAGMIYHPQGWQEDVFPLTESK
jgi:hypothetical protein